MEELSLVLDSAFFVDVHGSLNLALEYMREDPSVAYSPYCSEVRRLLRNLKGGQCRTKKHVFFGERSVKNLLLWKAFSLITLLGFWRV